MAGAWRAKHPNYFRAVTALDTTRPEGRLRFAKELGEIYQETFNLNVELSGLRPGSVIFDLGCGEGGGTIGLQRSFSDFRFVGINPTMISRREQRPVDVNVPIIEGSADSLTTDVRTTLEPNNLYPPQMILARSVFQLIDYIGENLEGNQNLLKDSLRDVYDALPTQGIALIYDSEYRDDGSEFYPKYIQAIREMGLNVKTEIKPSVYTEEHDADPFLCKNYLRIEKLQ